MVRDSGVAPGESSKLGCIHPMHFNEGGPAGLSLTQRAPLASAALLLVLVKCIQFAVDSQALFFYDSGAFILNGMGLAFLPYRSYVYGALLRVIAVPFHSLRAI